MKQLKGLYNTRHVVVNQIETNEEIVELASGRVIVITTAEWSGQSRMYNAALLHQLDTLDCSEIRIYVVDIDQADQGLIKIILGKQSHGNGEAVWLESGNIKARFVQGHSFERFKAYLHDHLPKRS